MSINNFYAMKKLTTYLPSILTMLLLSSMISCNQVEKEELLNNQQLQKTSTPIPCFNQRLVDLSADCGDTYEPVCACNTITFENECQAEAAGFYNVSAGPCTEQVNCESQLIDNFFDENWQCSTVYDPVCGCNGQTYSNWCGALMDGVTVWTPGECYTPIKDEVTDILKEYIDIDCYDEEHDPELVYVCTQELRPVCACKVMEFSNPCHARKAGFENFEEGRCFQNRCKSEEVKEMLRDVDMHCSTTFDPVCGCDGETYSSPCAAIKNGVLAYTPGKCRGMIGDPTENEIRIQQ